MTVRVGIFSGPKEVFADVSHVLPGSKFQYLFDLCFNDLCGLVQNVFESVLSMLGLFVHLLI